MSPKWSFVAALLELKSARVYVCVYVSSIHRSTWTVFGEWDAHHSVHTQICQHTPWQAAILYVSHASYRPFTSRPLAQSNGMMNNTSSLPSIYSHQKLEPLLYCNNHCCCLWWTPPLLYIFQSGRGRACSLITFTDKMQRDLWPWPRHLIASASAVPLSGNEAHSRNPIRSTQCAPKFSS